MTVLRLLARVMRDERGSEIVETALLLGLIVIVAVLGIKLYGEQLADRWMIVSLSL